MVLLIISIVLSIIALLGLAVLYARVEIIIFFKNFDYDVNIRIFKVIKINVKDKTKGEKKDKKDFAKIKTFFSRENWNNLKYLLSKSDLKISGFLIYGAPTPDVTAVLYGTLKGILYILDNMLQTTFKTYSRDYSIYPDMKNKKLEYEVTIRIYTRVIHYLVYKKRSKRYEEKLEGGVNNGRSASN